jgi:hypothetical protein
MMRVIAAGLLALGALIAAPLGVANADEIQVNGSYPKLSACEADGPYAELAHNDQLWTHWDCRQRGDGLYYLYLTN